MANQFGERIRQLRLKNNLFQRQVASHLEIDTPMLSKIERGERISKKEMVSRFATILKGDEKELLTLWLTDQLYDVAKDEEVGLSALEAAGKKIKTLKKQR